MSNYESVTIKEAFDEPSINENEKESFPHLQNNEDDHFTHGQMSITSPCALIASMTCEENVVNDDNAKFANTSKVMEKQIGRSKHPSR
ncbi:hypothetical protein GOP47_0012662 [Adiantum capillus-veneris]|uniref:Uncharacterized protein n=1 Tax=Adiantum capillus-veneris TaxID=13818 RepID=A0A9D4URQ8_ADICA|nr:hypothetical protein GOP47_0012662 [Adiantum capillus-veneris]